MPDVIDVTKPPYNAVGDQITDCTPAIQAALRDAAQTASSVYLPSGHYRLSRELHVSGETPVRGDESEEIR